MWEWLRRRWKPRALIVVYVPVTLSGGRTADEDAAVDRIRSEVAAWLAGVSPALVLHPDCRVEMWE